jgi:hypothetical protein
MASLEPLLCGLGARVDAAVRCFWQTRDRQAARQRAGGRTDAGARSAVTGGAQSIYRRQALELPGYYRPTKEWDLLVVTEGHLLAVVEAKSQVGPSFGNNFNNRTEEAMGSAMDLWTAYREGAFNEGVRPWLGYLFLLEDCPGSARPVRVKEPHFKVFPEFAHASYRTRYEIFCRKLVRERTYDSAAFLLSDRKALSYAEPAHDLRFESFVRSLLAHVIAFRGGT